MGTTTDASDYNSDVTLVYMVDVEGEREVVVRTSVVGPFAFIHDADGAAVDLPRIIRLIEAASYEILERPLLAKRCTSGRRTRPPRTRCSSSSTWASRGAGDPGSDRTPEGDGGG